MKKYVLNISQEKINEAYGHCKTGAKLLIVDQMEKMLANGIVRIEANIENYKNIFGKRVKLLSYLHLTGISVVDSASVFDLSSRGAKKFMANCMVSDDVFEILFKELGVMEIE